MSETLESVFKAVKPLLIPYGKKLDVRGDGEKNYAIYTVKPVTMFGREFPNLFFASVQIQKNFVGLYFFPIYTNPDKFTDLPPELKKCLKGKSCFHIKKSDPVLMKQIADLLKKGAELYKKGGII